MNLLLFTVVLENLGINKPTTILALLQNIEKVNDIFRAHMDTVRSCRAYVLSRSRNQNGSNLIILALGLEALKFQPLE